MAKCDMHLHSCFSKEYLIDPNSWETKNIWYKKLIKLTQAIITLNNKKKAKNWILYYRTGFSPEELYNRAKKNGMDFFCLTDHDTIDGWKDLIIKHPELKSKIITGVELTCKFPGKKFYLHISIYDLDERQFKQLKKIAGDFRKVTKYCKKNSLVCSLNHWGDSSLQNLGINGKDSKLKSSDLEYLWNLFDFIEARNGGDYKENNDVVEFRARKDGKIMLAGSDSHVGKVGIAWTEVDNAKTKKEFINEMLKGKTKIHGEHINKKRLKEEVIMQSRTYSGLFYTDNLKYFDKKLGVWDHGLTPGIFYLLIEKFFQIFILLFSGIAVALTTNNSK